jgi:hypothetical protein
MRYSATPTNLDGVEFLLIEKTVNVSSTKRKELSCFLDRICELFSTHLAHASIVT